MIPVLKLAATKFHEKAKAHRNKAEQQEKEEKAKLYADECMGQWRMCKDLGGGYAAPMVALKRTAMGPKGQAAGTIATSPKEVDGILRDALGEIFDGNIKDPEKTAEGYVAN